LPKAPKVESRSGHVRRYTLHRRLEIVRFRQFLEVPLFQCATIAKPCRDSRADPFAHRRVLHT